MTYSQAKMRISNPDAYTWQEVKEAAIFILSRLDSTQEDIDQAQDALTKGHRTMIHPEGQCQHRDPKTDTRCKRLATNHNETYCEEHERQAQERLAAYRRIQRTREFG